MSKAIDLVNQLLALTPTGNEAQPRRRTVTAKITPIKEVYTPPTITPESARIYLQAIANAGKRPILDAQTGEVRRYGAGLRAGQPMMDTDTNHIRADQAKAIIAFLGEKAYHPSRHGAALLRANAEARQALNPVPVTNQPYSRGSAAVANGFTPGTPVHGERERKDMLAKRDLMIGYALDAAKKGDVAKAKAFRDAADLLSLEIKNT